MADSKNGAWMSKAILMLALATPALAGNPITANWVYPVGGETLTSSTQISLTWNASVSGPIGNDIGQRDVFVSFNDGVTWEPLALQLYEGSGVDWWVKNKPTNQLRFKAIIQDYFGNAQEIVTGSITIVRATYPGEIVPTTDRDFETPGTVPQGIVREDGTLVALNHLNTPAECANCHGTYGSPVAPYDNWRGGMMAYASIDPIFVAAHAINDRVAPGSGDICLRCHISAGWYAGRSNPSDGRAILHEDRTGVSCDLCHRMVDPIASVENPKVDGSILADVAHIPDAFGNAMLVLDPDNFTRRGPFVIPPEVQFHGVLVSPFHRDSALCGSCHDVSNPAISLIAGTSEGMPNAFDTPAPAFTAAAMMSEQRTYSEWFFSAYNSPEGVYAPQFGGNRDYVASCQDCHMRDVTGRACFSELAPVRDDQPLHDLSGVNTWVLSILDQVDPSVVNPVYEVEPGVIVEMGSVWIQQGIQRARYMLQNAADLDLERTGNQLRVRVTNNTGHKLPSGYPEGRRMWLNVRFFNAADELVGESGAYDPKTGILTHDPALKVYEGKPIVNAALAALIGLPAGTSNFLALSNQWVKDNRIPPLGFSNAAYATFGGAPVGATYADGQNWDDTYYDLPAGAVRAEVRLLYQVTTREYMEFLRDTGGPGSPGELIYDLWNTNDKAPPEEMKVASLPLGLPGDMNCDGVISVSDIGGFVLALTNPAGYAAQYPDCDINNGDINGDSLITVSDIGPFVSLLTGG
jgi:hypothetical protein